MYKIIMQRQTSRRLVTWNEYRDRDSETDVMIQGGEDS